MKADEDAVLDAFGKNEQTRKVFWALFVVSKVIRLETGEERKSVLRHPAGLVLAQVLDPAAAQQIAEVLAGLVP